MAKNGKPMAIEPWSDCARGFLLRPTKTMHDVWATMARDTIYLVPSETGRAVTI